MMPDLIKNHLGLHAQALPLREQRLKLIASNLSNADTPGYKAVDLDFDAALRHAQGLQGDPLNTTNAVHFPTAQDGLNPFQVVRAGLQPNLDGNTVDGDVERAAYGRAAAHQQKGADKAQQNGQGISLFVVHNSK